MLADLRISARLSILTVLMVVLVSVVATLGFRGMGSMEERMKSMYEGRVVCLGQLSSILDNLHRIRVRIMWAVDAADPAARSVHMDKIADYDAMIGKEWKDYTSTT
ncbi:MAG: MCP four helix bundle domain-containing protein, partial [Magnetospirillum sp.]|nr:MCP four helix bundle domain-containing protein [Magnetospirillum sp.]